MPSSKFLLTAILAFFLLAIGIWTIFGLHLVSLDAIGTARCRISYGFNCIMTQHEDCCNYFADWCNKCKTSLWKDCPTLFNGKQSWVEKCTGYGQAGWNFDATFGPEDTDNDPVHFCKKACVQ